MKGGRGDDFITQPALLHQVKPCMAAQPWCHGNQKCPGTVTTMLSSGNMLHRERVY